jgi:hypothetical protein
MKRCTIICDNPSHIDIILHYLYQKKILKKILQINDKNAPFYGIIETSLKNNELKAILDKKFKNIFLMR